MPKEVNPWPTGEYELTEKSYIGEAPGKPHRVLEAGARIVYSGQPGLHMKPIDAAAKEAWARAEREDQLRPLDPTQSLDLSLDGDARVVRLQEENATLRAQLGALSEKLDRLPAAPPASAPSLPPSVMDLAPPAPPPPPPAPMLPGL